MSLEFKRDHSIVLVDDLLEYRPPSVSHLLSLRMDGVAADQRKLSEISPEILDWSYKVLKAFSVNTIRFLPNKESLLLAFDVQKQFINVAPYAYVIRAVSKMVPFFAETPEVQTELKQYLAIVMPLREEANLRLELEKDLRKQRLARVALKKAKGLTTSPDSSHSPAGTA